VKVTGSNSLGDHVIATSTLTMGMPDAWRAFGEGGDRRDRCDGLLQGLRRSELRLAAEAVLDALDDAGLTPADVDGMVTFTMDSNTEVAVARAAGIGDLKFFSKIHHGGGAACATVQQAAIAVATGVADCVWRIGLSTSVPVCGSARCSCG
jgi:acetyl-CoA acetyltransferase